MALSGIKFMGASVSSFQTTVGWSEQISTLNVTLVEDTRNGDSFISGVIGTPYSFSCGDLQFDGILRNSQSSKSPNGFIYNVQLIAPNDVLDGVKVILDGYYGQTNNIPNLFNVYAYWENLLGFGGSLINDTGMVWEATSVVASGNPYSGGLVVASGSNYGIRPGIEAIQNGGTNFGDGIYFRDHRYYVDFSGLPNPPAYYRIGNNDNLSIRELVDIVCKDGSCDYICKLTMATGFGPHRIWFDVKSRVNASPPGKISQFIAERSGFISVDQGSELRNEDVSIFLTGGDVQTLMMQQEVGSIIPFWGVLPNGQAVIGNGVGDSYRVSLYSYPISDIIGSIYYTIGYQELRLALSDYDSWASYVLHNNPVLARNIGLSSAWGVDDGALGFAFNPTFAHDFVQQNVAAAETFGSVNNNDTFINRSQIVYNYIRDIASQYYGKKFLVKTPTQIDFKLEPVTSRVIFSWEPTDAGYMDVGETPLGLDTFNQDYFSNYDGMFECFVKYSNANSGDLNSISNGNIVLQGTDLYVPARVLNEYGIVYVSDYGSSPSAVVIEVDTPLYFAGTSAIGDKNEIENIFGITNTEYWADVRNTNPIQIIPAPYTPVGVAIPMRSNLLSYGPWYSGVIQGRVDYRKYPDLVPWNYGGYDVLDLAAGSIIDNFVSQSQVVEAGTIQLPGYPELSPGDELVQDGPIVTDINVGTGPQGVVTTYNLRTFTPRLATFSNDNANRLRRIGLNMSQIRKTLRQVYKKVAYDGAFLSNSIYSFMGNPSRAIRRATPHTALVSHLIPHPDDPDHYVPMVSTQTFEESVGNIRADSGVIYQATACAGFETIFRGVIAGSGSQLTTMAKFSQPHSTLASGYVIDSGTTGIVGDSNFWNPVKLNGDFEWMTWGDNYYSGMHVRKNYGGDIDTARIMALRGPLALTSWGLNYGGKPTPNPSGDISYAQQSNSFISGVFYRSNLWNAGPVPLYWDNFRGVYGIPTIFKGYLDQTILPNGSGSLSIWINGKDTNYDMIVWNYSSTTTLNRNSKAIASFDQQENRYWVTWLDCG